MNSGLTFAIEQTCDLEHWVVQVKNPEDENEFIDITEPFNTREEAIEWAKKLSDCHHIYVADNF